MKKLGIIGGLSWLSTLEYYRHINQLCAQLTQPDQNLPMLIDSLDFVELTQLFHDRDGATEYITNRAQSLEAAGCQALLLASNTVHFTAQTVSSSINIPLLHICAAVGDALAAKGVKKALLLGTKFTMAMDFYKDYLAEHFQIEVLAPRGEDAAQVNQIIYNELVHGEFKASSAATYLDIIHRSAQIMGVEAAIMGCTEIPQLLSGHQAAIPLIDSTYEHAKLAIKHCLA